MLTLEVKASAGADLRNTVLPEMLDLARRTGCMIEVRGNDTLFWAVPDDSVADLQAAFDRLYPSSRYVATWIKQAAPRISRPYGSRADGSPKELSDVAE